MGLCTKVRKAVTKHITYTQQRVSGIPLWKLWPPETLGFVLAYSIRHELFHGTLSFLVIKNRQNKKDYN